MKYVPDDVEAERMRLELRLRMLEARDAARESFFGFVKYTWPEAILGAHHKKMADAFDRIADGSLKRLIINMPPRHSKSEFASYLLPAYLMGRDPRLQIIEATHTAELAVRFGRKVRDLMDTEKYQEVFSEVQLKADSKAAGRWDTNKGGSYFACLRRYALIHTITGIKPAGQIEVGDVLINAGKPVKVLEIYNSTHNATYSIQNLDCSANHPIWTMNRGWVYAADLVPDDYLCVESISDILKALLWRVYGYLEHTNVPSVVQHQIPLHQSQKRKMGKLRRAWDNIVRTLAGVREFLAGHGLPTYATPHSGTDRQRRAIQPRELPVGDTHTAAKQYTQQCQDSRQDFGGTCSRAGYYARGNSVQDGKGVRPSVFCQKTQEELRSYSAPEGLGWLRCKAAQILARSGKRTLSRQPQAWSIKYFQGVDRAAKVLFGVCVGVRRVGEVRVTHHDQPQHFVNFLTDGDHTFFADRVLTHNCGVGGAVTGRGADLLIIDDPHSEQDAMSELALENAWEWYQGGPRTRLQPGGAIVLVQTRWGTRDLTARLLKAQSSHNADKWEVIEFPAILPSGKPLWPEFWKIEELEAVRASLSVQKWNAMYQQQPTNDEGAILKREWWRRWQYDESPPVEYLIQSYDTAYSKKETADFSVITTWGVFYPSEDEGAHIILLDVKRGRWDFPELKRIALDEYKKWNPDNVLIEAKATGITLQQEMRRAGIPVTMYNPGGRRAGTDKISRAHAVAPMLESGMVWAPETDWADELVEECAAFPNGDNDDQVDSTTQALMRFRQGNFLKLSIDEEDETTDEQGLVPEYY